MQDNLFGGLCRDAAHFNGGHFVDQHVANLRVFFVDAGFFDGQLGLHVFHGVVFDNRTYARKGRSARFAVDADADIHLCAVAGLGRPGEAFFHGLNHKAGVDHLLAGNGVSGLQQFQLVGGGNGHVSGLLVV